MRTIPHLALGLFLTSSAALMGACSSSDSAGASSGGDSANDAGGGASDPAARGHDGGGGAGKGQDASSSSSQDSGAATAAPDGGLHGDLSGYCTGTLLSPAILERAMGPGYWLGDGSLSAPAGAVVLLTYQFQQWGAVFLFDDGSAAMVSTNTGLVQGKDFTSSCVASPVYESWPPDALVQTSTFYADASLSGAPCTVPRGTQLDDLFFVANTGSFEPGKTYGITAKQLKPLCGLTTAYTKDMVFAALVKQ